MSTPERQRIDLELKAAARRVWALGDYHRFSRDLLWGLGAELVKACGVGPHQRVLDVACGSGNTAIQAASSGASVVACDLTLENFAAGRDEAERAGVVVEWVEGDVEHLPFPDSAFDVVTSSVGAMWAPDHRATAHELVRVCRAGGTIGLVNFAADGLLCEFLAVFDRYTPPPPPWASSPTLWGDRDHLAELFGDRVCSLVVTPAEYTETLPGGPAGYVNYYKDTFGPVVATYASLAGQPEIAATLDSDFIRFAARANRGRPDGPAELVFETVLVVARTRKAASPT